ncbi:hypothetical protein BT96DRAFT_926541 [Gymnopus androsaceus JB14]|uniref:Uncharacterized protein n=1 Tax=Gymnopus androsaceus JB14 TaxID=1447944 RepID=A0A6A4GVV3_9AGAR|nr:hypothetical protein BT96DRAFT_926541 [Gymnopus androsaceus JB14]
MSSPLTPSSSASAASKAIRPNPDIEPDDQWKENLKAQIQVNLNTMVQDTQLQLEQNLKKQPGDSVRLHKEFAAAMNDIQKLATETFKEELERERQERRWATGHELPPDWAENMKKGQQAILDQIKGGKSSSNADGSTIDSPLETASPVSPSNPRSMQIPDHASRARTIIGRRHGRRQ